jgi:hypothetical protein
LIAAAVAATLLAAGGITYAAIRSGGTAAPPGPATGDPAGTAAGPPSSSPPSPSAEAAAGSSVPATPTTPATSTVPAAYLGVWAGDRRRLVIGRGRAGEVVVHATSVDTDAFCEGEGRLVTAADSGLRYDAWVTKGVPSMAECSDSGPQAVRLGPDATLTWSGGGRTATLRKAGSARVDRAYLGRWRYASRTGYTQTLIVRQGAVNTAAIRLVSDNHGKHCEGSALLFEGGDTLIIGPTMIDAASSADNCDAGGPSSFTVSSGQLHRTFLSGKTSPRTYTRLK